MSRTTRTVTGLVTIGLAAAVGTLASGTAAAAPTGPPTTSVATEQASNAEASRPIPRIASRWAAAWNSGQPEKVAALFTDDAVYTDHAFGATFTGRDGVATWVGITNASITAAHIDVRSAFRSGDQVAIQWNFTGTLVGALQSFSVPAVTLLQLRRGQIVTNDDYYNLADLLQQSGLPADTDVMARLSAAPSAHR